MYFFKVVNFNFNLLNQSARDNLIKNKYAIKIIIISTQNVIIYFKFATKLKKRKSICHLLQVVLIVSSAIPGDR